MESYIKSFCEQAAARRDTVAIVDQGGSRRTSYRQLEDMCRRLAMKIKEMGITSGTPILISIGRSREYVAAYLGIQIAGCVAVPILPEYPKDRVAQIKADCNAELVITEDFFHDLRKYKLAELVEVGEETPAHLLYTSGSTGKPKGIRHTVRSLYRIVSQNIGLSVIGERVIQAAINPFSFIVYVADVLTPLIMGGEVHILDNSMRKDVNRLADYFLEHKINMAFIVPQILKNFHNKSPYLRRVLVGSEMVSEIYSDTYEIVCVYGSSETGPMMYFKIDRSYLNTPIGKPLSGYEASLLPCGEGSGENEGELCVRGVFADGYLNLPEETARAFEKHTDGTVTFHTGDFVFRDADGNYTYMNRADWMVKINGQRVELLELENVIAAVPGVKKVVVEAFKDTDGQTYLCAFFIADGCTEERLHELLREKIPDYMMPRYFKKMDKLPLNTNGKVKRKVLLPPSLDEYKTIYVAPKTAIERTICSALSEVLHCGQVGVQDDFFSLGGDSIKVLKLITVLKDAVGNVLTPEDVLLCRTPERIANLLKKRNVGKEGEFDTVRTVPLTEAQAGVYVECLKNPKSTMYNLPFAMLLPQQTDREKFVWALENVISHHPVFRAAIRLRHDRPEMVFDVHNCTIARLQAESFQGAKQRFVRPFDLETEPLCRLALCDTPEGLVFLFDAHHLIFDGTSVRIFLNQLAYAYQGQTIPSEKMSFFAVAEEEKNLQEKAEYREAQYFFKKNFEGTEFDAGLMSDVDASKEEAGAGALSISAEKMLTFSEVDDFVKKNGITENTLFMAAFAYTLSIYTGENASCFASVNSGRHTAQLLDTIGMFVKTLPLRFEIPEDGKVVDFLLEVQNGFYQTVAHDCISFGELMRDYGVHTDISFVYQADSLLGIHIEDEFSKMERLPLGDSSSKMIFMVMKGREKYEFFVRYRKQNYSEALIRGFAKTVFTIVNGMLHHKRLNELPLITEEEKAFLDFINQTEIPYDRKLTVNDVFCRIAAENSERVALVYGENRYNYGTLDHVTKRIASYIAKKGIGEEDFVAVLSKRNDMAVFAIWGAIRAGAAFQILDPAYPQKRLNYMIEESQAKLLIAERALRPMLTEYHGDVLYMDELSALPDAPDFFKEVRPESAIAINYTSGTSGNPKGVVWENQNVFAFCYANQIILKMDADSRMASYSSFGFDSVVGDVIAPMLVGASLYIIPDEIRLDLEKVDEFYTKNAITHGFMTTQVARAFAERTKCNSIQALLAGGEKLTPFVPPKHFRFINAYGPCESIAYICYYGVRDNSRIQRIGKPSINTKLYVTDRLGRLLPAGALGELSVSGWQVGRGYFGLPEKTADAFAENPYSSQPGYERIYKTRDVVRILPDANFEYIGRADNQVKINGYRIELSEIEEVLRRFPGIVDATVAAFEKTDGGKYVAAYVVSAAEIDKEALRSFICAEKPVYMVPAVIVQIPSIPYTQNYKVNKKALPVPKYIKNTGKMPQNKVQQKIYDIVSQVLGHQDFDIQTDLFTVGMTSLGMIKLGVMLGEEFSVPVKFSNIMEHPTVEMLSEFLGDAPAAGVLSSAEDYPLMQNQMGVFVDHIANKGMTRYNIPLFLKLSKNLDIKRLYDAICVAWDAHPYLKATLKHDEEGNIRAVRNDAMTPVVDILHLPQLPASDSLIRPFEILGGRLYRAEIYVTGEGNALFFDMHHLVMDGMSYGILLRDINAAYMGKTPEKESFTAFDEAMEEEKTAESPQAKAYYDALLSGANTECTPEVCPETEQIGCASFSKDFSDCSEAIKEYCSQNHVTPSAFFNAVFGYTLSEFLRMDDISYCTVYHGRNDSRLANTVAMLVKTIPVRSRVDAAVRILDFISAVQKQLVETMAKDTVSFAELSRRYDLKADIFFNYQGDNFAFDTVGNQPAEMLPLTLPDAKAPFSVEIFLKNGVYHAEAVYRTDYFCQEFVSSFIWAMLHVATDFVTATKLCEVSALSKEERISCARMNERKAPFERIPAHILFERQAEAHPDRIAVKTKHTVLTYAALNKKANGVAHALLALGAGNGDLIGMMLDRSEMIPVIELGILKAGCAFLPMLPFYPEERLEYCLKDAGCRFAIAEGKLIEKSKTVFLDTQPYRTISVEELSREEKDFAPKVEILQNQLAYTIYTSGSTGKPKGVMIEQHSLSNFVQTAGLREVLAKGRTILGMVSISFDMSISEIFFSLCHGKTVYIATEKEIHAPELLLGAMKEHKIDLMLSTPSFVWSLFSLPGFARTVAQLKGIVLGAESFPPVLFAKLKACNSAMLIANGYGPTEGTQVCSMKLLTEEKDISIGRPFPNVELFVVDENDHLLPHYAVGELLIAGEGVCRGYINLPERNKSSFIEIGGRRAYKTGDLVRINRKNELEFFGRADKQIKLRGFRIELGEIEAVLQSFAGVRQCCVILRNQGENGFLAGFFTADTAIDVEELKEYMRARLTQYMVPSFIMQIEKMPLTVNGKVDVKALPEVRREKRSGRTAKKSLEEKITEVFCSVLKLDACYVDDNFFELGGTSLLASKAVMQLKSSGLAVEYQDIFDYQTAEKLALFLEGRKEKLPSEEITERQEESAEGGFKNVLAHNAVEYADEVQRKPLGNVLLTGATGFLGIHILRELLASEEGQIVCLIRKGKFESVETRLRAVLVYYFSSDFEKELQERVTILEGDITDADLRKKLEGVPFDTLINCAASVKHYAKDHSIEFVNVQGVQNLISLVKERKARMIQISTTSVSGTHTEESYRKKVRMAENQLFVIDDMKNQYIQSKYRAERLMLQAISEGMRGKIIRVGNLVGRYTDGEFQMNMRTNAFLNSLRGFANIGTFPASHMTKPVKFSPIDCTARAVVLLAGTNDSFTAFHADGRFDFDQMLMLKAMSRCGIAIKPVKDVEFQAALARRMQDADANEKVSALLTNYRPDLHAVETDNGFTTNILYRLGFFWPVIDSEALERMIRKLDSMDFFFMD